MAVRGGAGASLVEPLFHDLQGHAARSAFTRVAKACGLLPHWHAFRRGMASDMLAAGCKLHEVLAGGGWRSSAFLRYLHTQDLEDRLALEQAFIASDDEAP